MKGSCENMWSSKCRAVVKTCRVESVELVKTCREVNAGQL